jgi:diaminohydroxyphosphoribosylaminopyrimidine deaminase/5-amino-6-(5-phosphoribosylamino)uracil reductase
MMARALALARRGEALTSPNPMVGAVLLRDGKIVGEGFHTYDTLRHAEINALEAAGDAARGATMYVTLEPCCITGRTPPCTRAIIAAGVARVVAAMPDPNPAVAGRGFRELRLAKIPVEVGLCETEASHLNEAFAKWIRTRMPFVTLKSALTRDGHLVLPPKPTSSSSRAKASHGQADHSKNLWITSVASRAEVQRMRHASDALLTGIGTVIADDPLLTDRTALPRRRPLLRVILDSRLRLDPHSRLVRSANNDVLVFTHASASGARAKALRDAGVEICECAALGNLREDTDNPAAKATSSNAGGTIIPARIDLRAVLAELGRRQILSVLLEAGATLNESALSADLVDKVRLFYSPKLAFPERNRPGRPANGPELSTGDASTRTPHEQMTTDRKISYMSIELFGPDTAVEGYFHNVYS